jgi:hypothetical protein
VVEGLVRERELDRVALRQGCLDPGALEVRAGELQLLRLDIETEEPHARILLTKDGQHGAHPAAHLEEPRARLERRSVANQPVPPVLGLLDQPLLLRRRIAMHVARYGKSLSFRARRKRAGHATEHWGQDLSSIERSGGPCARPMPVNPGLTDSRTM